MRHLDLFVQERELINIEITVFTFSHHLGLLLLFPLLTSLHLLLLLLFLLSLLTAGILVVVFVRFHQLVDHVLQRGLLIQFLDLGPSLHHYVFEVHAELILTQLLKICIMTLSLIVMYDVIKGDRLMSFEYLLLHIVLGFLKVMSLGLDLFDLLVCKHESRHSCVTFEVCIGIILDQERTMVDDGTLRQSLNDKEIIFDSFVVGNGNLNYTILDEEHSVSDLVLLTDVLALLKCDSLHGQD